MTMVSYAQNGEDVMLSRALRDVAHGFYVDVGAAGPTEHSVTRAFYERGWTGINIEPTERYFTELAAARPHDVNLRVALDDHKGEAVFHVVEGTGLSTLEGGIAEAHKGGGWAQSRVVVPTRTLADVCAEHAPPVIHFLKVDVEGAEERVLRGADFSRFRPWIVVVEATRPMSPEPDYAGWEPVLTGAHYEFVWFDGLNRFYVSAEKLEELRQHFRVPVNYFDDFQTYDVATERLKAELREARAWTQTVEAEAERLRQALQAAHTTREAVNDAASAMQRRVDELQARMLEVDAQRTRAEAAEGAAERARQAAQAAEASLNTVNGAFAFLQGRAGDLQAAVNTLQGELNAVRGREHSLHAAVAAQRADYEARLAAQNEQLHHRRLAHDSAEARAAGLEAQLAALRPPPAPALPGAPVGRRNTRSAARRLLMGLYRVTLRPVVRPVMWRTRTFLVAGLRHDLLLATAGVAEQVSPRLAALQAVGSQLLASGEAQRQASRDVAAQLVETRLHVSGAAESLRSALDRPAPPVDVARELAPLVQSMEAALLTLTVTASREGVRE